MIQTEHLFKWYATGALRSYVLRDVNLEIRQGEFVSIMGPSGSGKSTLLHILGMLDDPSEGDYRFLDEPVAALSERRRAELQKRHIGFVFQNYHLIDDLTVYENLETPLIYTEMKAPARQALVSDMLDRFQIVGKKDLFPGQLSGGQQQLVGIARSIITSPKVILADEPTGNLNSSQGEEIMNLFTKLNADGTTIVQVTHSEKNAAYGTRVINLLDGRITP